jgi:hypothetical protein
MSRKLCLALYLALSLSLVACGRGKSEDAKRVALSGNWGLAQIAECAERNVKSDRLVLYGNGTFDQHTLFKDGQRYDSTGNHWEYLGAIRSVSTRGWM